MNDMPKVGPYSLMRKIAVSDIAVSYAAEIPTDRRTSRVVSLKFLSPACSTDGGFSAEIKKDAALVHELNHINIGQTWDLAERDGVLYLCLEYIEGASLRRLLEQTGPAPAPVAAFIASEIAAALSYAHARTSDDAAPDGIIHGDLRPRKVLISRTGAVKLVDFAVSRARKLADADPVHVSEREGEIMAYTSPSVARGGVPSVASDIFSAAAIAYRLLVGRRLYNGSDYQEVHGQAIDGAFPSIMDLAPDCPAELAEIIMRGLGASERPIYSSAQAFRSALSAWIRRNAVGFGRHKVKDHFGKALTEANTGRGSRPLSRREFSALDSASLLHDGAPGTESSASVSLVDVFAARHESLDTEAAVRAAFGTADADRGDSAEFEGESTLAASKPQIRPDVTSGEADADARQATQAMIPDSALGELDIDYSLDEPSKDEAEESDESPLIPEADPDRIFRETLGKTGKSDAEEADKEDAASTTTDESPPSDSTDEELPAESTDGRIQAGVSDGPRGATRQFSPESNVFGDENRATTPPPPTEANTRPSTQEIESPLRNETEAMGTLHEVFDDEEPPRSGGAASDARYPNVDTEPAEPIYADENTPSASSPSTAELESSGELYGLHDEETEVPRAALARRSMSSSDEAGSAIYDPSSPSDNFLEYDDTDVRKPGRGSLGYLIILLAFAGLGIGAWYLYREVRDIQDGAEVAKSQGIFVTSRPQGANVLLDDQPTGKTAPAQIAIEEIGASHRVSVEMPGYETPTSQQATTSADRRAEVDFELTPLPHLIHVESEPQGASVYLDGELAGTTPIDIGPVRQDPRDGVNLLLIHDELGRKSVAHEWDPGSERSSITVNMSIGTTVQ